MAQWYRAVVTIPDDTGLPANSVQNTFSFVTAGSGDRDLIASDIKTRLDGFYTAIMDDLATYMHWSAMSLKVYDMTDEQPRFPFHDTTFTISDPITTNNDMPPEVARVLSFEGARESGVNMRRRRGRVYIGPCQEASPNDLLRMTTGPLGRLITAADDFLLTPETSLTDWAVYSPYTHHGVPVGTKFTNEEDFPEIPDALPASFTPVARCWVDNSWDTQRRRGVAATSRTIVVKP